MNIYKKLNNKIGIIGQNILVNNDNITAFYILDCLNYRILNNNGVEQHINSLETLFTTLAMQRPNFSFSFVKINKILTPKDLESNLIDTVHLWDPNYKEVPKIFAKYIQKSNQKITLLAVKIENDDISDVENMSIKALLRSYLDNAVQEFLSLKNVKVDIAKIKAIEKSLYDVISNYAVRASRELTFYTYISSLFPSYEISYNKNSYVEKNMTPILGAVNQSIKSDFGYFEMSNEGVNLFNMKDQITYGSILKILKFPNMIDSNNFNLDLPNIMINVKTIPKDKARVMIKRNRADLEFEQESAADANARDLEELESNLDLAQQALNNISEGNYLCEMEASILVLANDIQTLKTKRQKIISTLADIDVISSISFDQGLEFINNFIKMNPKNYSHLCDLRFPLSFQLDNGTIVGDSDSKFTSPAIGEDIL